MTRLTVDYLGASDGLQDERRLVIVDGNPDESFCECMLRTIFPPSGSLQVVVYDRHALLVFWFVVDHDLTMSEIESFAGQDILAIDSLGRGGGEIWMLASVVRAGMTLSTLLRRGMDHIAETSYQEERLAARDWMDLGSGHPNLKLRQFVNSEREWKRSDFDAMFGLDADPGSRLLRACGYRKVSNSPDRWVDEKEA